MEAVNQLLVALEVHRFDFCFIGAGYEKEVDEFLTVNPGLGGRFNRKLRFASYAPDELVEIAIRYGEPRATVIEPAAREALNMACKTLRAYLAPDGQHGIDVMQNGRFARNVVERAERLRDSRWPPAPHRPGFGHRRGPGDAAHPGHSRRGDRRMRGKACAATALSGCASQG